MTTPATTAATLDSAATAFDLAAKRLREAAETLDGLSGLPALDLPPLAKNWAQSVADVAQRTAIGLRASARNVREARTIREAGACNQHPETEA